jgi:hypothetical protein
MADTFIIFDESANELAGISAADALILLGVHARQHAITSNLDHTSTATVGKILQADANGLPVSATNTDTEVAAAVSAAHAAVTVSAPISVTGQVLKLVNNAAGTITEIDTGPLSNLDTVVPTSKAVTTAIAGFSGGYEPVTNGDATTPELLFSNGDVLMTSMGV